MSDLSDSAGLTRLTDENLPDLLAAENGVLILARSDCGYCAAYEEEILSLRHRGQLQGIAVGKIILDTAGSGRFKRENPWLASLDSLPYTLIYRKGSRVDEFAASKGSYLLERLESVRSTSVQ